MPTAPKLISAVLLAGLTWFASMMALPLLSEDGKLPGFAVTNTVLAALIGWRWLGPRLPTKIMTAFAHGLTAAILIGLTSLFAQGVMRMLRQSWRKAYAGPVEAVADVAAIMARFGKLLADPVLIATLAGGAILVALIANMTGRRGG